METIGNSGHKQTSPEVVLDGHTMIQDLCQLIGYVWAEGNQRQTMPSEHFQSLAETFNRKYRAIEMQSPKRILNDSFYLKRAAVELKELKKDLQIKSDKLAIHEFHMDNMRRLDGRSVACGDGEYLSETLEKMAYSMEMEANAAMKKPESFDDIDDDWTGRGNGTTEIQPNLI